MTDESSAIESVRAAGRWSRTLELLQELDPQWTEAYAKMATNPWTGGVLPAKDVALIALGLSAAITNLDATAFRRNVRASLSAGANREEILEVLKMAAILALHSMSLGAPILIEEAKAAGKPLTPSGDKPPTPSCDKMKEIGQWNAAWDPFAELDPLWTEEFIGAGAGFYTNGVLTPKFVELISIAFDASITHMYAPGTRRHIKAALAMGASAAEIMCVLKICVSLGANALDMAVPIVAYEAAAFQPAPQQASGFVEAAALADVPPGTSTTATVGGKHVAIFNIGGKIFATDDACPHAGSSLGSGRLDGSVVKCRAHGLCFDVTTGASASGSGPAIKTYPTRIAGDKILVNA